MILYKFATRARPEKFKKAICNIAELATQPYKILVSADADDATMNNAEMKRWIGERKKIKILYGTKVSKIEAINRDMEYSGDWDILVNMSDDMKFIVPAFDKHIINAFRGNSKGFVHFPDGSRTAHELSTLSIISRRYYCIDRYIYHPAYRSLWCDNEAITVAKKRNEYKFVNINIFEHEHPDWQKAKTDQLYIENESYDLIDKETYYRRQSLGFP